MPLHISAEIIKLIALIISEVLVFLTNHMLYSLLNCETFMEWKEAIILSSK